MSRKPEFLVGLMLSAYAGGIILSEYLGLAVVIAVAVAVVCSGLAYNRLLAVCIVAAIAIFLGGSRYLSYTEPALNDISKLRSKVAGFNGWISQEPELKNDKIRFIVQCRSAEIGGQTIPVSGRVIVYVPVSLLKNGAAYQYADNITIKNSIYEPADATNPGQFSYKKYLERQGVYSASSLRSKEQITVTEHGMGNPFIFYGTKIRNYLVSGIEQAVGGPEAGVMAGMVLGTYAYLPEEIYQAFSRTGTLHLLAASGFNCVCLILFSTVFLKIARITPYSRNLILIALVLVYLAVVGMKPSMERAAVMACLGLLSVPVRRIPVYKNLLFVAALLILILRPTELFDVGFQLSFIAVIALIWIVPEIEKWIPLHDRLQEKLVNCSMHLKRIYLKAVLLVLQTAVATIAITVLTAPIIVYYFNYISTVTLLTNIVMVAVVYVIFIAGVVAGGLQFIPSLAAVAGYVGKWSTMLSLKMINYFGNQDWSVVMAASPSFLTIVFYYLTIFILLYFLRSSRGAKCA